MPFKMFGIISYIPLSFYYKYKYSLVFYPNHMLKYKLKREIDDLVDYNDEREFIL